MKDIVGHRLPKFTDDQKRKLKNSVDFVGINYYSSFFSNHKEVINPAQASWQQDSLTDFERKICYVFLMIYTKMLNFFSNSIVFSKC